jgi:hypothetical protein
MPHIVNGRTICLWCGLPGHRKPECWIRAEARVNPDEHDRAAAAWCDKHGDKQGRPPMVEVRKEIARLRRLAARREARAMRRAG